MIKMDKFILFQEASSGQRDHLENIYRTSCSFDRDRGDAIEFNTAEEAITVMNYLNKRDGRQLQILNLKTTEEVLSI